MFTDTSRESEDGDDDGDDDDDDNGGSDDDDGQHIVGIPRWPTFSGSFGSQGSARKCSQTLRVSLRDNALLEVHAG